MISRKTQDPRKTGMKGQDRTVSPLLLCSDILVWPGERRAPVVARLTSLIAIGNVDITVDHVRAPREIGDGGNTRRTIVPWREMAGNRWSEEWRSPWWVVSNLEAQPQRGANVTAQNTRATRTNVHHAIHWAEPRIHLRLQHTILARNIRSEVCSPLRGVAAPAP